MSDDVCGGFDVQNQEAPGGDEDCTTGHLPLSLRDNVQFIRINASLAKGPTLGRALNAQRFAAEDFFLQVAFVHWSLNVGRGCHCRSCRRTLGLHALSIIPRDMRLRDCSLTVPRASGHLLHWVASQGSSSS